jgi:hypothetical protein
MGDPCRSSSQIPYAGCCNPAIQILPAYPGCLCAPPKNPDKLILASRCPIYVLVYVLLTYLEG